MNLALMTDNEILSLIASRAVEVRITNNLRQIDLSKKSGVPISTIRVFERSGIISFVYLVKLLRALSIIDVLDSLFKKPEITDLQSAIKDTKNSRKRVRK